MALAKLAVAFFLCIEVPLTLIGAYLSLRDPTGFVQILLPSSLQLPPEGDALTIIHFLSQMYGVTLVLLGLGEALIFLVRHQVETKRALLIAMVAADFIHLFVFCKLWFLSGRRQLERWASWTPQEQLAVVTNVPVIMVALLLRLLYLTTSKSQLQGRSKAKSA